MRLQPEEVMIASVLAEANLQEFIRLLVTIGSHLLPSFKGSLLCMIRIVQDESLLFIKLHIEVDLIRGERLLWEHFIHVWIDPLIVQFYSPEDPSSTIIKDLYASDEGFLQVQLARGHVACVLVRQLEPDVFDVLSDLVPDDDEASPCE